MATGVVVKPTRELLHRTRWVAHWVSEQVREPWKLVVPLR
jgi:hypothetical protein